MFNFIQDSLNECCFWVNLEIVRWFWRPVSYVWAPLRVIASNTACTQQQRQQIKADDDGDDQTHVFFEHEPKSVCVCVYIPLVFVVAFSFLIHSLSFSFIVFSKSLVNWITGVPY